MPNTPAGTPAISVQGAAMTYPDGTEALLPVNLAIAQGEFVSLLGPSGCGKSTLLKMMAGLLVPSSGALAVGSGRLAFVFQSPTLMPWATVATNVRLPLDLAGTPRPEAQARVAGALALVGLDGFATRLPRALSGGMQMRASIARALVTQPDLLLMDEPFGALDEITRHKLDTDLLALWHARGLTVVFVTHSIHEAVFLSTRVVMMAARPGRIVEEFAIEEPYPRTMDFPMTPRFAVHARRLQDSLVRASRLQDSLVQTSGAAA